jgi:DNA-binding response OmpR family regulator
MWQYIDFFPIERNEWAMGRIIASLQLRACKLNIHNSYTSDPVKVPLLLISQHTITIEGKMINVTKHEFDFLRLLSNRNGYCSREEIAEYVYGFSECSDDAINSLIRRLRDKLGDDSHAPQYLQTSGTGGFRLINWAKGSE